MAEIIPLRGCDLSLSALEAEVDLAWQEYERFSAVIMKCRDRFSCYRIPRLNDQREAALNRWREARRLRLEARMESA